MLLVAVGTAVVGIVWAMAAALGPADSGPAAFGDGIGTTTPAPATAPAAVAAAPDCSMPDGDRSSGDGVIRAFEHAFYVQRSGVAAHALISPDVAPDAYFATAANVQAGIDSVPAGTTYCLSVSSVRTDIYAVVLTESGPDGPGVQYRSRFTTSAGAGQYVIEAAAQN